MFALDEKYYWKLRKIFLVDAKASKSEHPKGRSVNFCESFVQF